MLALTLDSHVVASGEHVSQDLGDELIILDLRAGIYYGVRDVGARIWTLLQQRRSVRDIRDQLLVEYNVEPERCASDLLTLLSELARRSLVQVSDAA